MTASRMTVADAWPPAYPEWDDLCAEEQLAEMRLDLRSEFFDSFAADPTVIVECPTDGRVCVQFDGVCPDCGRETPASKRVPLYIPTEVAP